MKPPASMNIEEEKIQLNETGPFKEIYADGLLAVQSSNGVVKLSFFSDAATTKGEVSRDVILRVCLPLPVLPFINANLQDAAVRHGLPSVLPITNA